MNQNARRISGIQGMYHIICLHTTTPQSTTGASPAELILAEDNYILT